MVNFIVCEDNEIILKKNVDIINNTMFNCNVNYRVHAFSNYCDELKSMINNNIGFKIYVLDIELENISGIEIAHKIRDVDNESIIIISTIHTEYLPYAIKSKLLIYEFISKFDDYEKNLSKIILRLINTYKKNNLIK